MVALKARDGICPGARSESLTSTRVPLELATELFFFAGSGSPSTCATRLLADITGVVLSNTGGSTSTVYSRSRRPEGQRASRMKSR